MAGSLDKDIRLKLTIDGKDANTTLKLSVDLLEQVIKKTGDQQEAAAKSYEELKKLLDKIGTYSGKLLETFGSSYNKYFSSIESGVKKELNDWQNKEKKKIEEERKEALSHARTKKQKEKINQEYDKKEDILEEEKQAKAKDRMLTWFNYQKAISIAQATIATFKAANEALSTPPWGPWSYVAMAAAVATGLANVALITNQKFPGYKRGGAIVGEEGPEIIAPFQDYASGQSKLIAMTMMTLKDEIRSGRIEHNISNYSSDKGLVSAINKLNKRLDEGIDARAYLDDRQAKKIYNRGSGQNRRGKV